MNGGSGYFKLGLFVIAGVSLIVAGILFFGASALFTEFVPVETATTRSVEGLQVGAAVKFTGVTVGRVSRIDPAMWRFRAADTTRRDEIRRYIIIDLELERAAVASRGLEIFKSDLAEVVERGLRARMASSGLTGPPFIELVFLDPRAEPVVLPPWTPEVPYIPSAPSQMSELISGVNTIVAQVSQLDLVGTVADLRRLANRVDQAFDELKPNELATKTSALIDEVRVSNRRLNEILDGPAVRRLTEDLPEISSRTRDLTAQLDDLLRDPRVQTLLTNLDATMAAAPPAVADARQLLRRLDVLISNQSRELESIIRDLQRVLEDAAAVIEDAKSNPSRVLFGQPPPRIEPGGSK